jgi:catechol 2,3-dioxygenase-like lactoylglutathione lyase family enzyme
MKIMNVKRLTPILNVSNIGESFAWFEKLGWKKGWDWGDPPSFGGVCSGECEIFLCQDGQGSRGGPLPRHTGDDDTGGVWMTWWVSSPAEVDAAHALALAQGLTVTWPPTDEPWGVREFHLRHPDGHTFRVSAGIEGPEDES